MIFYFTGTGNSLYIASAIAKSQGETLTSVAAEFYNKENDFNYRLAPGEMLGFVYPVYAWAPPKMVLDFIKRIKITGEKPYVFSVATCGEEEGKTTEILEKQLKASGLKLDSAFSVAMPNNYIIGFDVDSPEKEQETLAAAEKALGKINSVLSERRRDRSMLLPGGLAGIKSGLINYGFNHFAMNTKKFYADENCTACGLCEKVCPVHSIHVKGKPAWEKNCTMCLACINRCPARSIQYGNGTVKKGRYYHPQIGELENEVSR